MDNNQFNQLVNNIMLKIENFFYSNPDYHEIDCEINYNMLIIEFQNKNKIIINKQEYIQEIWLATKNNGYHFKFFNHCWLCKKNNMDFWNILTNCCFLECGKKIKFN
ncbi:MAG: iron donor protein CyaY [Buchnera aphidicola (Eriosoma harunire)]